MNEDLKTPTDIPAQSPERNIFNTVTPASKLTSMVLFIALPFIGVWFGYTNAPERYVSVERLVIKEVPATDVVVGTGDRVRSEVCNDVFTTVEMADCAKRLQDEALARLEVAVGTAQQSHDEIAAIFEELGGITPPEPFSFALENEQFLEQVHEYCRALTVLNWGGSIYPLHVSSCVTDFVQYLASIVEQNDLHHSAARKDSLRQQEVSDNQKTEGNEDVDVPHTDEDLGVHFLLPADWLIFAENYTMGHQSVTIIMCLVSLVGEATYCLCMRMVMIQHKLGFRCMINRMTKFLRSGQMIFLLFHKLYSTKML